MPHVALAHDREQSFCRNKFLCPVESMFEHGASADEVDILFGKSVATQIFNERAQPTPLSRSQYDSATSWTSRFGSRCKKHLRDGRAILKPAEPKHYLWVGCSGPPMAAILWSRLDLIILSVLGTKLNSDHLDRRSEFSSLRAFNWSFPRGSWLHGP